MRRVIGADAVRVVEAQSAALGETVLPLLKAHDARLDGMDEAITSLNKRIHSVDQRQSLFAEMTLGQRMLWLVRGTH
jgi:hypothetical protein